jgi:hypothetical protein
MNKTTKLLLLLLLFFCMPIQADWKIDHKQSLAILNTEYRPELRVRLEDKSLLIIYLNSSFILQEIDEINPLFGRITTYQDRELVIKGFRTFDKTGEKIEYVKPRP